MDSKLFTIEDFLSYQEKLQNSINTNNGEFFLASFLNAVNSPQNILTSSLRNIAT